MRAWLLTAAIGAGLVSSACTEAFGPGPDAPGPLVGLRFDHPPGRQDRALVAQHGRVVAVVRADSVVVVETEAAIPTLRAISGVTFVSGPLGDSDRDEILVALYRDDRDLQRMLRAMSRLRAREVRMFAFEGAPAQVYGYVALYRLPELDRLDLEGTRVSVEIDPAFLAD